MAFPKEKSLLELKSATRDIIGEATIHLDSESWHEWLDLCNETFRYSITSYSPEIKKKMIYFRMDKNELKTMVDMLPKHNTDHSQLTRHTSVYRVKIDDSRSQISAQSAVIVHQHLLDGINSHIDAGESRLFLVGEYADELIVNPDGDLQFIKRELKLKNRRLDKGSHWPI